MRKYISKINIRNFRRLIIRTMRHPASPEKLSWAVANGLFVGMAVPIGLQIPVVLLFAFIFRLPKTLSFLATLITNPYTVPFIYPPVCLFGSKVLGYDLTFKEINTDLMDVIRDFTLPKFFELGWTLLASLLVGGFILGVIFAIIGFCATYGFIMILRRRYEKKLIRKLAMRHHAD
jgi:uncharacterized protein (DUF2062 family)